MLHTSENLQAAEDDSWTPRKHDKAIKAAAEGRSSGVIRLYYAPCSGYGIGHGCPHGGIQTVGAFETVALASDSSEAENHRVAAQFELRDACYRRVIID